MQRLLAISATALLAVGATASTAAGSSGSGSVQTSGLITDVVGGVVGGVTDTVSDVVDGVTGNSGGGSGSGGSSGDDKSGDNRSGDKGDPRTDKGREPDHAHGNKLPKAKAPVSGKSVKVEPARGHVKVKLPGAKRALPLEDAASLPVGSLVDASRGALKLSSEDKGGDTDAATFSGAAFTVRQKAGAEFTTLVLRGRPSCGAARKSSAPVAGISRKRRRAGRKLWGSGKGRFRTRGRYGAATVRGTVWMTQNRCNGTLVRVKRGIVDVHDFAKKKTVAVEAGERYLAKRPKRR